MSEKLKSSKYTPEQLKGWRSAGFFIFRLFLVWGMFSLLMHTPGMSIAEIAVLACLGGVSIVWSAGEYIRG